MDAPTTDLTRTFAFELARADGDADGNTLEGYAAVFDQETVIDSWEGKFVEKIASGAFRKTLRERTPVVQFDHGRHPLVGSIPIAEPPETREDDKGLFVRAGLHDNWLIQPVKDAIKSGAIPGMSFRFTITKERWEDPKDAKSLPVRTIQEVKLFELGPVVWPAYEGTSVDIRDLVADPKRRAELARAIVLGTPDPGAATPPEPPTQHSQSRTSAEPDAEAAVPDEPPPHSSKSHAQRLQYARRIEAARRGIHVHGGTHDE